jgi:hypothetical protein
MKVIIIKESFEINMNENVEFPIICKTLKRQSSKVDFSNILLNTANNKIS